MAACDEGARQSRAVAAVLGAGRVPLGFGCAGGRPRRGGKRASVASVVKTGERMGMIGGPGHVMA